MFLSFHEVDGFFYAYLFGAPMSSTGKNTISITTYRGKTVSVPFQFFKESAFNYSQGSKEIYPIVSIENFNPVENTKFSGEFVNNAELNYFPIYTDVEETIEDPENILIEAKVIPFDFRYEISLATKSESEWDALKKAIMSKFSFGSDKIIIFDAENEKQCYYTLENRDIPREDGVYETLVTAVLTCWVKLGQDQTADRCTRVNIDLRQQTISI